MLIPSYFTERGPKNLLFKRPFKSSEILQKSETKFTAGTSGHCPIGVCYLELIETFLLWLEVSTNTV